MIGLTYSVNLQPGRFPGFFFGAVLPATVPIALVVEVAAVPNGPDISRARPGRCADNGADNTTYNGAGWAEHDRAGSSADRRAGERAA